MDIFDEIKRLCKIRGITIDDLMKMIGRSGIAVYAGWRQRGCYPRSEDLYKISKVLEVSMEHFFGDNEGIVVNQNKIDFINKLDFLTKEDFDVLTNLNSEQIKNLIALAKSMSC